MTRHTLWLALAMLLAAAAPPVRVAADDVLDAGIRAEMAEDWPEAIRIYRLELERDPNRADLWVRLGDIHARQGDLHAAARTFGQAAGIWPDNLALQIKASEAYQVTSQWAEALTAMNRAIELDPDNQDFLFIRAEMAGASNNAAITRDSFERLAVLNPERIDVLFDLAHAQTWVGDLDAASRTYARLLTLRPDHQQALLDGAQVDSWRGDYAGAVARLEHYEAVHGPSEEQQRRLAQTWAWAHRSSRAHPLLDSLWLANPNDYQVAYTRTLAYANGRQPREAVAELENLDNLGADREDTAFMRRYVHTPLRSSATVDAQVYSDSDHLDIYGIRVEGERALAPDTFLQAGAEYQHLTGRRGTGLENRDGGRDAEYRAAWVGARRRFSPEWAGDAQLGAGNADGHEKFLYRAGVTYTPQDTVSVRLQQDRVFHLVSPRTASLGIYQDRTMLQGTWDVDLLHTLDAEASFGALSDDNDRWEVSLAPRRAIVRSQHYNLDVGVRGGWFGYDDDLDNGYFDPSLYQEYVVTGFLYWKINDEDGVSVTLASGVSRDDRRSGFDFAGDATVEGTFALGPDWQLGIRGAATLNELSQRGVDDFHAVSAGLNLTRRF